MDKHFNKFNNKRIGLCCWFGEIPNYVKDLLNQNSEYFDTIYFITDSAIEVETSRIAVLKFSQSEVINSLGFGEFLHKILKIGPAAVSDLLFYFPKKFLKNYLETDEENRVMYFDTNMLIWSQNLVNQLFNRIDLEGKLFIKKNQNHYLDGASCGYYSSNFSVDDKLSFNDEVLLRILLEYLRTDTTNRYTLLGPTFLNNEELNKKCEGLFRTSVQLKSAEIDLNNIHAGMEYLYHQNRYPMTIGFTISHTLIKSCGFKIKAFGISGYGDYIKISYERL